MNVLLFGEFSGLHTCLKAGLKELGYNATLLTHGDTFKSFESDVLIKEILSNDNLYEKTTKNIYNVFTINKLHKCNYDIVQFMNPFTREVTNVFNIAERSIINLVNTIPKSFMLVAGCDSYVYDAFQSSVEGKWLCNNCKSDTNVCDFSSIKNREWNKKFSEALTGIIPTVKKGFYEQAYSKALNVYDTIPFPINTDKIIYRENIVKNKIKIFHGISRQGFKGSGLILEAMRQISDKYPNDIEMVTAEKMPFDEYITNLYNCNVVIDQVFSDSLGMNALFSMATGRVVVTGYYDKIFSEPIPAIQAKPDIDFIVKQLEKILDSKDMIRDLGYSSRKYVEKNHNYIKIASKYLDAWAR